MMIYLTELTALDPYDGQIKTWAGPNVTAASEEEAKGILQGMGLGYCRVIGVLEEEISTSIDIDTKSSLN